ncbi:MAG TPA: hypothetical protein VLA93_22690 [Pyrinomonadaceae bacterium]|nr:hypothetical protein [Pyrinomonadaceae bacterium]
MMTAKSTAKSARVPVIFSLSCAAILLATLCVTSASGQQAGLRTSISQSTSLQEPDSTTDRYRVIFPKVYKDPSSYPFKKAKDGAPFLEFKRVQLNNFLNELNDAGARGYRLVSAAHDGIPIAIVTSAAVQYEYELVITRSIISSLLDRKDGFEESSKRGFHLGNSLNVSEQRGFASKVDFGGNVSCLVRVTSWIVPFVQENKDDPRSHTNQHERKSDSS